MMRITEEWIMWHAPGPAVAKNGRSLSEAGRFAARCRTRDGKTCWAECSGSARNPYYVFIDWSVSEQEPDFGCSCSSPHHPCKHILGLMYELLSDKPFTTAELPSYVIKMRAKHAAERARAEQRLIRARRYDAAVRDKKIELQLDVLAKAEQLSDELISGGLASIPDLPAQSLDRLAVELGNCDLPGARSALERAALLERLSRQDETRAGRCYGEMLRELSALRALIVRSRAFLDEQRASESYAAEDPVLYEQLGGVWKEEELRELGSCRRNARLVQLSFDVSFDEGRRAYTERGFWVELTRGDLVRSCNVRGTRDGKYTSVDDSCFELLEIPMLYEAPGTACQRVWWERAVPQSVAAEEREAILRFARPRIPDVVEDARRQLAEPLLPGWVPALVTVGAVGFADGTPVLADRDGARIALRDRREDGPELSSVQRLTVLQDPPAAGDALFGLVFYDEGTRSICLHPYSLVTANEIVRLQF